MKKTVLKSALLISSFAATTTMLQAQSNNVTLGTGALNSSTTGSYNNAIGYYPLSSNTSGSNNNAIGYYSLYSNTTGYYNNALGLYALYSNTSGYCNNAMGYYSLYSNTTGYYNNAIGYYALRYNTSGGSNNAIGYYSLYSNTSGNSNTAFGQYALYANTTGSYNIGLGYYAGRYIANGSTANAASTNSIFLGYNTKAQADNQTNQIVIGYNAVGNGSNSVTLGSDAITKTVLKGSVEVGTSLGLSVSAKNLDQNLSAPYNLTFLKNTGRLLLGWNYTGGKGEQTFISNRGGGDKGGFGFYDYSNTGDMTHIMTLAGTGNVGIGTANPDQMLTVNGIIHAKEVKIDLAGALADYVFTPEYSLMPLDKVEQFVKANNHLPDMPSAVEVEEQGLNMGEMQNKLLQKIEELTLYIIEQDKRIKELEGKNN